MCAEGLSYADALASIRLVRPRACPNLGFAVQLRRFEASCKSEGAVIPVASLTEKTVNVQGAVVGGLDGNR